MQKVLTAQEVRNECDPLSLNMPQVANNTGHKEIIGQERAINALKLGLGIKAHGFNIYVAGASGTGKLTAVTNFAGEIARKEQIPSDWCYVSNFKDSYNPGKLKLPAGSATQFRKEMKILIHDIYSALVKVFESEEFAAKKEKLINEFENEQAKILGVISEHAEKESFIVKQTPASIVTIPVIDNKPITDEQLKKMSEQQIDDLNRKQDRLQEEISTALREIRKREKATNEKLDKLEKEIAQSAIGNLINDLNEKYTAIPEVNKYLVQLNEDIMDNLPQFIKSQNNPNPKDNTDSAFLKRYEINTLVDNGAIMGAPVIFERNPTYNNLIGRVEKESYMGTLFTDFTMIRKGSLHTANGGYLIIRIEELLRNYFSWDGLKRALKNNEIVIEDATDQLGYITSRSLKPEPIPLNVKIILIGESIYYRLLYEYDSDFRDLFKVKADFDNVMERNIATVYDYAAFIRAICINEHLLVPDNTAIAKIVEYGSKLAGDQNKLSTHFGTIADILREANYYAGQENALSLKDVHIKNTIERKVYRSNLIQEKLTEMITNKQIFIDITNNKTGQINGLSVLDIGDLSFGIPSRITCTVSLGKEGIIAIEREAELSGPIHTKGVLILTGYLSGKFMQDKPVSLAAHLVFEQSYSEVEGDSASSTELYAILSALSNLPIKQGIAVTGSVNQKGEIQPIGGVNEKIEGYFEICRRMGLNGEQGVIIPMANIRNLMLKEEVFEAVKEGKFNIWAVDTIEDGIEVLTGLKAGSIWEEGTVFYYVNNTLGLFAERAKQFSMPEQGLYIEE